MSAADEKSFATIWKKEIIFEADSVVLLGDAMARQTTKDITEEQSLGILETRIRTLRLDRIDLTQNEFEFRVSPRFNDLVKDIKKNGQQFPIIVRKIPDTNTFQIVSGFRRVRALKHLNWPEVKAIVRELDDDAAYKISYMENEKRKSLTGVDKAHAIAKLRVLGKTNDQICEIYNIGRKQLGRYSKIENSPDILKQAIDEQTIETSHGVLLADALKQFGAKFELDHWLTRVIEKKLSVRELEKEIRKAYRKSTTKRRYIEVKKTGGFRLYAMTFEPGKTDEDTRQMMIEKLKGALELLEREDKAIYVTRRR